MSFKTDLKNNIETSALIPAVLSSIQLEHLEESILVFF